MLSCGRDEVCCDGWRLAKVRNFDQFQDFDCGNEDLNEFIRIDALQHRNELMAETWLFVMEDEQGRLYAPVAFISLLNDSIHLTTNRQKRPIPNHMRAYDSFPAVKIGRLGVRVEVQGKGIGREMLTCIKALFTTENRTGCRFLTVDAYNLEPTLTFYQKNGFQFLSEDDSEQHTRILFYDLKRFSISPAS